MKYGMHIPVLLQAVYLQSLEKFLMPQVIVLQRGDKEAFTETTRTAKKINLAFVGKFIYQIGLVNIDITVFDYLLKTLDSYGVFHVIKLIIKN